MDLKKFDLIVIIFCEGLYFSQDFVWAIIL